MNKEIETVVQEAQERESETVSKWMNKHGVNFEIKIPVTGGVTYELTVNGKKYILEKKVKFVTNGTTTTCTQEYIEKEVV